MPAIRNASPNRRRMASEVAAQPLGMSHQFYLANIVAGIAPDWSVELYADGPETGTIIVMPDDADDEVGPTYFVHREGPMLCLDQLHWDRYSSVGRFADLDGVAQALRCKLLAEASMSAPVSHTLH